jgi:hypothetical protein
MATYQAAHSSFSPTSTTNPATISSLSNISAVQTEIAAAWHT